MNRKLLILSVIAVATPVVAFLPEYSFATSLIDATELATNQATMTDTISDIGKMLLTVGFVAVAWKWGKAALFG